MSSSSTASAFATELRQAARRLARSPGFAALAIATLGIGINAAMFALMDALLFRAPVHVAQPGDVVRVQFRLEDPAEPVLLDRTHYPNFIALRDSGAFAAVAAYTAREVSIGYGRDASLVTAMLVSREFFDVLRPAPHLGHFISGESSIPDGGDRAIVSYGFWQRRFGGDPRVVGAAITIDGTIYERAREALVSHPDVERATLAQSSPFMSGSGAGPRTAERSFADLWSNRESAYRSVVDVGLFTTVGSRSLRGRDFTESDRAGAQAVAIINAPLARHLWPDRDALGECMWLDDSPTCMRIVGVLGGVWKFSALKRDKMALYVPLGTNPAKVLRSD